MTMTQDRPAEVLEPLVDGPPAAGSAILARLQRLAEVVFPAPQVPQRATRRTVLGYLLAFVAGVSYLLLIPAGRTHLTRVWGEDGGIFLQFALHGRFPAMVLTPYTGYVHVVPRLTAEAISHLPVAWWAVALAVTAAALRTGVALLVFASTNGHLRSRLPRLLIAAAVVLLPAGNNEALNNLANLHWFILFGAFWVVLWRPARWWQCLVAMAAIMLSVTTSPLGLLLAPIAAVRLALPSRRDRAPAIAYFVALAVQFGPLVAAERPHRPFEVTAGLEAAAARGPLVTFTGSELAGAWYRPVASLIPGFFGWPAAVAVLALAGIAGIAVVRGTWSRRVVTVAALAIGSAVMLSNLAANWSGMLKLAVGGAVTEVQRYSAGPCLFFATALVLGLAEVPPPRWRHAMTAARVAVAAMVVAGVVVNWQSNMSRLEGITWQEGMTAAEQQCAAGGPTGRIVTIPARAIIDVPCEDLPHR